MSASVGEASGPPISRLGLVLEKISAGVDALIRVIVVVLTVELVLVVSAAVVCRYVLKLPFASSDELAIIPFVWLTFLGAAIGMRENSHPTLSMLVDVLKPRHARMVEMFGMTCTVYFLCFMLYRGASVASFMTSQGSPILEIPMVWVYGVVPVSAAMMLIHLVTNFTRRSRLQLVDIGPILVAVIGLWLFMNHVDMKTHVYWVMTGALCVFLLTNMPIAIAMGLTTLVGLWVSGFPDVQLINRMIGGLNNFTLLAVPLFVLTGAIMATGSLAKRLFEFANACVGWIRGGLGLSNLTVSTLFADISGSAVADTAAVGSVMIPNMVRRGYDVNFTTALQASAGTLGMMIPPSITMILYAWVTGVSTATLFLASFLPAFLVVISFAIVIYVTAVRRGYPKEDRFQLSEFFRTGRESFFALFAPVVIMGGIVGGVFTATEAGGVACVYCFIVTAIIYRELTWTSFVDMLIDTASQVGRMTFMVATAIGMSWIIIVNQGPQQLAGAIQDITQNPFFVLLILNVVLIILGTFLEPASTLLIVVPVILPLLAAVGIDPVVFGVIFTINCALGMLTPPVGLCLFVACQISGAKMESAFMAMMPFMLIMCVDLVILSFWPQIALIVPQLLGMY